VETPIEAQVTVVSRYWVHLYMFGWRSGKDQ